MKRAIITIIFSVFALSAIAQSGLKKQYERATNALIHGLSSNNEDSLRYAVLFYEKYERIYKKSSVASKQIVSDPWDVFEFQSMAYNRLNDDKILTLLDSTVRPLYHQQKPESFDNYYSIVQDVIDFLSRPQQPQLTQQRQIAILYELAHELHNEATAAGEQSLRLSYIKSIVGNAEAAKGNTVEALRWLEEARASGLPYLEGARGTQDYFRYLNTLTLLIQGYTLVSNYTAGIEVANQLIGMTRSFTTPYSEYYLGALCAKAELCARSGDIAGMGTIVVQIDSVLSYGEGMSQQTTDYARQIVNNYRDATHGSTNTSGMLTETKEQLAKQLAEMEANPSTELFYYNSVLYQYVPLLLADNQLREAMDILEHAERHINQQYANVPYATRVVEGLYGSAWKSLGNVPKSLKHLHKSEQMFELAADHGLQYLMMMMSFIDILYNANDIAYCKLYLDKINDFLEKNLTSQFENELKLIKAVMPIMYYYIGYTDISTDEISEILSTQGANSRNSQLDFFRPELGAILAKRGDYTAAEHIFKETFTLATSDMTRLQALLGLIYSNCFLNNTAAIDYYETYEQAIRQLITQVMESFDAEGRQSFWDSQTQQLAMTSNLVLHKFGAESKARELAYNTALYVRSMQDRKSSKRLRWKEVKKMLDEDEVSIEFVSLTDTVNPAPSYYAALVLRKDYSSPQLVKLCPVSAIDNIWREVIHTDKKLINKLFSPNDTTLYGMVWRKIAPLLKPGDKVYYATVGNLNRINHNIISNGRQQMGDIYTLREVSSTAHIAQLKKTSQHRGGKASIYGGLEYEEDINLMAAEARNIIHHTTMAQRTDATRGGNSRGAINSKLKGTLDEALAIDKVLKEKGYNTTLITGTKGNEESFKALSGQAPEILHIGTHGFIINNTQDNDKHFNIISSGFDGRTRQVNLMLYCGLRMAGSNAAWRGEELPPDIEDGILTAYEISQTDLSGCKLVVLSACETGLGFCNYFGTSTGLIRALKSAGVDAIVASLWEVPDKPTSLLMQTMFSLIAEGREVHEALREAQKAVRNKYPEPYNWAAFVVID